MLLRKLREARENEKGFTLIELLVVILIVGILAAIALPTFLGQQKKGQDAAAKSDARNMVSQVESCFTDAQTYTGCDVTNTQLLQAASGLNLVAGATPAAGEVTVTPNAAVGFTIKAASKSGNVFIITKTNGQIARSCTGSGGACPASLTW